MNKEPLYIRLYEHYKMLIISGTLQAGGKLPSIRTSATQMGLSKTTVEAAYMQLAAEGYVNAIPGSGYFVSELDYREISAPEPVSETSIPNQVAPIYDFASSTVDFKSFNFNLWRRYIKSALRNTERLVAYGHPQGEYDLRVALMNYVKEARGVVCTPEQIIVGSGVQSLLQILCVLIPDASSVVFTGNGFMQGQAVFRDRKYTTYSCNHISISFLKEKEAKLVYVSPSHTTDWGEVMPMKERLELLKFAQQQNAHIIEDDFDSEFRYYTRPIPALQSLDGGRNVIYLGSFSRLLIPSLRIAFMVLPMELLDVYLEKGKYYNQTASTAEQIALCQFIRDGHLKKQTKKARKLYMMKSHQLCSCIEEIFKGKAKALPGTGGFLVRLEVKSKKSAQELANLAMGKGILVKVAEEDRKMTSPNLLLSCAGVDEADFEKAISLLFEALELE